MKILMVSSFLPYPLINGGNVRLYNLLKNISKDFEITLICEKRDFQSRKDVGEVKKFCKKLITVDRKKQWSFGNIFRSIFGLDSFLVVGHTLPEMKKIIKEELKNEDYDLIHVETFYVMQNLPKTVIPVVLAEHNVEYLVYKRFADRSIFPLRPFLNWDIWKMKNKEEYFWKKSKVLIAVSEEDRKIMNSNEIVQNGVDIKKFKLRDPNFKFEEEGKRILFIGDFKWIENRDTAKWILKKIWPQVRAKIDKLKLWIVGRKIPAKIRKLSSDSYVIFDENAPKDTSLIYRRAFLLLSPIRIGGGTSFKILEAMASGVPVITTSLGKESITKGNEIIVANTTEEVIDSLSRLLRDKSYYSYLAKSARALIEKEYDWKKITFKLEDIYTNTIQNV